MEEGFIQQDISGTSSYSLSSFRKSLEGKAQEVQDPFIELESIWSTYIHPGTEHILMNDVSLGRSVDRYVHPTIWTRTSLEICIGVFAS